MQKNDELYIPWRLELNKLTMVTHVSSLRTVTRLL